MPLRRFVGLALAAFFAAAPARADDPKRSFAIESVETAMSAYEQRGFGYQSKANSVSLLQPGSQRLLVMQPQALITARQDEHITHRLWFPVDIVTSASANAIDRDRPVDAISGASRQNESIAFDWKVAYETRRWVATAHNVVHLEENFRSWTNGIGGTYAFADGASTVAANVNQVADWFSKLTDTGVKRGRTTRSTSNGNVGFTQVLTPTTVVHANYGVSAQYGELGNTWNSTPLVDGTRTAERLPHDRYRHAVVGRFAQYLPWDGALKGFYRFYADDWGVTAHAVEGQLLQRVHPLVYLRGSYRYYAQTSVNFFTTLAFPSQTQFTSDSDLGKLETHTVGGKASFEIPWVFAGGHIDVGFERYWRTDGLTVNVALWQAGARF